MLCYAILRYSLKCLHITHVHIADLSGNAYRLCVSKLLVAPLSMEFSRRVRDVSVPDSASVGDRGSDDMGAIIGKAMLLVVLILVVYIRS